MDKKGPQLCLYNSCTACSACANICKHGAIGMSEDNHGEHHPVIDMDKCIGCGLCEKVCPEKESGRPERYGNPDVYYCWLQASENRKQSTSGGAGYAIACTVIRQGGHVWGAAYDENMMVRYIEANTIEELKPIQKSKYVQSYVGDSFTHIKEELKRGESVLFTGTSCHVKGLRAYLQKDYDNLLTVDLVCHGVPGQGVFRKYKEWLEKKYDDHMIFFDFRPKEEDGQERVCRTKATFEKRGKVNIELKENGYFVGFQRNLFLREACFRCTCKGEQRYADITIADFWGLGKVEPFKENLQRPYGISMLAFNSNKSKILLPHLQNDLLMEKRSYEEASISNTQYYISAKPSPLKENFWKEWKQFSWEELTDKYLTYTAKDLVLYVIKKHTPPICYLMLNHWRNG